MTHDNSIDLNDFFALAGADSNLSIHEVIFVAVADNAGKLSEHSLLASGNFDRGRIYRSGLDNGASLTRYRGTSVLVVQPFARERSVFSEVRWLAIPDSDILLFGSIVSVQQELDRHLARSPADPRLVARLARLRRDDETWSVLSLPACSPEIRDALAVIDPQLAAGLKDGDAFQFGIHYGRQVEFEYEATMASRNARSAIPNSLTHSLAGPELPFTYMSTDNNTVRGVIKVWITDTIHGWRKCRLVARVLFSGEPKAQFYSKESFSLMVASSKSQLRNSKSQSQYNRGERQRDLKHRCYRSAHLLAFSIVLRGEAVPQVEQCDRECGSVFELGSTC